MYKFGSIPSGRQFGNDFDNPIYRTFPSPVLIDYVNGDIITRDIPTNRTIATTAPVNCSCLHGTPFIQSDGSCGCHSNIDAVEPTPPIKPIFNTGTTPVNQPSSGLNCTQEAKLCPDGKTYVSRNPAKNCAFNDCPPNVTQTKFDVNIIDTIKSNPLLLVGGAVAIYLLLKGK